MNDREREKLVKILSPLSHTMESEKKWGFGSGSGRTYPIPGRNRYPNMFGLPDSNLTRKLDIFGFHKHFLNNCLLTKVKESVFIQLETSFYLN